MQRRVADEKARHGGSIHARAKGTVGDFVDRWLDGIESHRRATTFAQYKFLIETYVIPHLGRKRLDEVDVDDIGEFYARLRRDHVATSVRAAIGTRLRTIFATAVKQRKIPFNPALLIDKPKHLAKETRFLDAQQAARFLVAARGDRLEAFFTLALTAGLRYGELGGLRWEDIDFDNGFLSVRQQLTEAGGVLSFSLPKTSSSRRRVELGELAVEALRRRREAYEREGHGSELVFTTEAGQPLRHSNLRSRSFQPIAERAGVSVTLHGLRHAMASLMAPSGAKVVQERLGHSTVKLTLDRYSHVLPTLQREAAEELDQVLTTQIKALEAR
ncbi:MAG: site-specific integrase [Candidatus Tumulicola sp.]